MIELLLTDRQKDKDESLSCVGLEQIAIVAYLTCTITLALTYELYVWQKLLTRLHNLYAYMPPQISRQV